MKWMVVLVFAPFLSFANPADTIIQGVNVQFEFSPSIFPYSWLTSPINANGESLSSAEVERSTRITSIALKKYPASVLKENLVAVYFLKSMSFFNVGYGGTNSNIAIYLTNNGEEEGYTDEYIEQTFHHEFSSILFRKYARLLDTSLWKNLNDKQFIYNDPEEGVGAIRNNETSQSLDTVLCKRGLLTQYSMSSLENDVNTYAQNLFMPTPSFWNAVDRFPAVRKKVTLLIHFYNKIDRRFTEQRFRQGMF